MAIQTYASSTPIYRQPDVILPKSFFEARKVTTEHEDSLGYEQWWKEHIKRCHEGYRDGGYYVTGPYYYHLNFKKINLLDEADRPLIEHPFYAYEDQQLFNDVETARSAHKGLMLITGRGFGKSFDVASIIEHEFTFVPASEIIVSSSVALYATELWAKIEMGLNSQPDDLRLSLLENTKEYKLAGIRVKLDGKEKLMGSFSKMRKIIYDNDAGRTRGMRPNIHAFEEVGAWTGAAKLEDCISQTEASWWRGSVFSCFPILIGTGGMMKSGGSRDAKKMGLDPSAHNLMSFEYGEHKTCKFFPAFKKYGGYYERTGVSDEVGAKAHLDGRREALKGNIAKYNQFRQEQPYDIFEAFEESGGSTFNQDYLEKQFNKIGRTPSLQDMVMRADLFPVYADDGQTVIDVRMVPNPKGDFEFLKSELPRRGEDGKVIRNLYISGCDSFDASEEDVRPELSPGCVRVFKRAWKASEVGRIFVAGITLRTRNGSEFYRKSFLLNMFYRCKMLYEHTNKGISQWYITNNLAEEYLYPRPILDGIVKNSKTSNKYGLPMPIQVKSAIIDGYKDYIDEGYDDGMEEGINTQQMLFPSQLKDAMDFRWGSKEHHETMASAICLFADQSMYKETIRESKKNARHFPKFTRDPYGNQVFK